ncbi:hypothetical protein OROMI_009554 [Orobanche minor]
MRVLSHQVRVLSHQVQVPQMRVPNHQVQSVVMNHPQAPATVVGDQAPGIVPIAVVGDQAPSTPQQEPTAFDVLMSIVAGLIPPHLRTEADSEEAR